MKVIILAGGLGTRLCTVVKDMPKPMAEIDGTPLNKMSILRQYIYEKNIGDIVKIKYLRNRKETEIDVTLARK